MHLSLARCGFRLRSFILTVQASAEPLQPPFELSDKESRQPVQILHNPTTGDHRHACSAAKAYKTELLY